MIDKEWLELNAKLQQKKNAVRKALRDLGILKREGQNNFDKYRYFSEAQYKQLFTELFSFNGLELKFDELEYGIFEGTEKQSNGRMPKIKFTLFDIETGFGEDTTITGEGMDKGDKAGYKAYTGALKYYLANTFMVATGDDPEKDSPEEKMNKRKIQQAPAEIPVRPNESLAFVPYPDGDAAVAGKTLGKLWNEMDQGKNTIYLELRRAGDNETKSHIAKIDAYVAATRGGKA